MDEELNEELDEELDVGLNEELEDELDEELNEEPEERPEVELADCWPEEELADCCASSSPLTTSVIAGSLELAPPKLIFIEAGSIFFDLD